MLAFSNEHTHRAKQEWASDNTPPSKKISESLEYSLEKTRNVLHNTKDYSVLQGKYFIRVALTNFLIQTGETREFIVRKILQNLALDPGLQAVYLAPCSTRNNSSASSEQNVFCLHFYMELFCFLTKTLVTTHRLAPNVVRCGFPVFLCVFC